MMIDSTLSITGTSSPVLSVGEIQNANIADDAVTAIKINDLAVTTAKLGEMSVITSKINDHAVTGSKMATGTIEEYNIATNAITTNKIAADNVTFGKIVDASTGSILIGRGNNGEGAYKEMTIDSTLDITGGGTPVLFGWCDTKRKYSRQCRNSY